MRDPDITTLRLFLTLTDSVNISKASSQESLAPSAISKRISALEELLGYKLFLRRGRKGLELTPEGRVFREAAERILEEVDTSLGLKDFQDRAKPVTLRLTASESTFSGRLVEDIASFLAKPAHQHIKVEFNLSHSIAIPSQVKVQHDLLGVVAGFAPTEGVMAYHYFEELAAAYVPTDHPLAKESQITFNQLVNYPLIVVDGWVTSLKYLKRHNNFHIERVQIRQTTPTVYLGIRLMQQGLGVFVSTGSLRLEALSRAGIVKVPIVDLPYQPTQHILHSVDFKLSPWSKALLKHLIGGVSPPKRAPIPTPHKPQSPE